jgi:glycosyltransferase involved in cell wall biosynthesis
MVRPFFSVVTPSFNQGAYVRACLESVAGQAGEDYEHLVFDNCSTDGSAAVAAEFPRVRWVCESDRGQSHAVNKGFAAARGEILCWINTDDAYPPGTFRLLRKVFADPGVHVVFGDVEQVGYEGSASGRVTAVFEDRLDLVRWWSRKARLHQPAVFFRRAARETTGWLREDLHFAMDYEYWWRMSGQHRFVRVPEILAIQHRQPESKTVRNWQAVLAERERIFAPHYHLVDNGDPKALNREMRRALARSFVQMGYTARGAAVVVLLLRALLTHPPTVLHPDAWGLAGRVFRF